MKKISTALILTLLPYITSAQATLGANSGIEPLLRNLHILINRRLIPLFVGLAFLYTMYAVVDFMATGQDSQKKADKKQRIFWGIIGIVIILSIWGLVAIVGSTFGVFAGGTLQVNS